jgi:hypothetical protein
MTKQVWQRRANLIQPSSLARLKLKYLAHMPFLRFKMSSPNSSFDQFVIVIGSPVVVILYPDNKFVRMYEASVR